MPGSKEKNFKINLGAIHLFTGVFKEDPWIYHEESNDFGIDYRVELTEEDNASGLHFFVQLKGQQKSKHLGGGSYVSYNLDIARLKQYCNIVAPVYLVVADLARNQGYWIFLQKYATENLDPGWRSRSTGTVAIRVPTSNLISDTERLIAEFHNHRRYQTLQCLEKMISEYESMDNRFEIDFAISGESKRLMLRPIADVKFNVKMDIASIGETEFNKYLRGLPMTIKPGDVQIKGSGLIEHIFDSLPETGGTLQIALRKSISLSFRRFGPDGRLRAAIDHIPSEMTGGPLEMKFTSTTAMNLMTIRGTIFPEERRYRFGFDLALGAWSGRRLRFLPLFDAIHDLLFGECDKDRLCVIVEDNYEYEHDLPASYVAPFKEKLGRLIMSLKAARRVAIQQNINPVLPEGMSEGDFASIEFLSRLLEGMDATDGPLQWVSANFTQDLVREILKLNEDQEPIHLALESEVERDFFGENLTILGCKRYISNVRLAGDVAAIRKHLLETEEDLRLEFEPTDETSHYVRWEAMPPTLHLPEVTPATGVSNRE